MLSVRVLEKIFDFSDLHRESVKYQGYTKLYECSDQTRRIFRLWRTIDSTGRQPIHSVQRIGNRDRDGNPLVKTGRRIPLVRGAFVPRFHWNPFYGVSFDPSVPVNLTNYIPKGETSLPRKLGGEQVREFRSTHVKRVCTCALLRLFPALLAMPISSENQYGRWDEKRAPARHRVLY